MKDKDKGYTGARVDGEWKGVMRTMDLVIDVNNLQGSKAWTTTEISLDSYIHES